MNTTLMHPLLPQGLLVAIIAFPLLALAVQVLLGWFARPLSERATARLVGTAFAGATLASAGAIAWVALHRAPAIHVSLGTWFAMGHYHFEWALVGDRLSLPFAAFCAVLFGIISAFSRRYLHREPGFSRFYLLLSLFGGATQLVVLAGGLDLVFFGWELVGLTSALLIAFFHERAKPVEHGLRAFVTYRVCDVGLLAALVWLHHTVGTSGIEAPTGAPWGGFASPSSGRDATLVGLLLLWAALGKSAQVPFGGWLPRAMEGPTPSSAIFYGAISVHLGPYLLLRAAPIFEHSRLASTLVVLVGLATALHATFVGRTQSDVKSALAYASMTQVGIVFVEIGLGLHVLALTHVLGHACVRSLQILRAPNLLHEHHGLERAMASELPRTGGHLERLVPVAAQPWLYRHALERGYFDAILRDYVAGGLIRALRWVDDIERAWVSWLCGTTASTSAPAVPTPEPLLGTESERPGTAA